MTAAVSSRITVHTILPNPPFSGASSSAAVPSSSRVADHGAYGYVIDAEDRISGVDEAWVAFARGNGAPALADAVIGTSLWRHIAEPTTRHLYELIMERVRALGRAVRVPFRCDAPGLVREMELAISPLDAGALALVVSTLRTRSRAPVPLLDDDVPRTETLVRLCGWCKRLWHDGAWREIEDAMHACDAFTGQPVPGVTHSICAECERGVMELLEQD